MRGIGGSAMAVNESPALPLYTSPPRITLASHPMPERAPDGTSPSPLDAPRQPSLAQAYAALESLLRASPRGRWFLAEFARRNRSAETDLLLEAIARTAAPPRTRSMLTVPRASER